MDTLTKFTIPGILLVLTVAFGFWVSHLGKPYNVALFNVHKLIALGAVVVAIIQFVQVFKVADPQALVITLLIVAGLCVIALFATGALMSLDKLDYMLTLTVHRIASVVMVVAMALVAYLLVSNF